MSLKTKCKKIVALGFGACMIGATVGAANLNNYPNMFIEDGNFNGLLVVGRDSLAIDTIGMTNIALGLQQAAVTETTVCPDNGTPEVQVSEGVKIEDSEMLYLGNDIEDVTSTLDESDLPNILADGNFNENEGETDNDEDYTQELRFVDGTGVFNVYQDDDDAEEADYYIQFSDNDDFPAYRYVMEFDNPVEFTTESGGEAADDLESGIIELQSQAYTITDAKFTGSDPNIIIDELTMLVGDTERWLTQGDVITKAVNGVEHEIEMIDVTEDADSCGLNVDGSVIWIDVDDTETVQGLTIGVTDAKAVHTETYDADICKVSLGATELKLRHNNEVEMDGDEVEGSTVYLHSQGDAGTLVAGEWTGIVIEWTPEDTLYMQSGDELVDPIFDNFKYVFGGVSIEDPETILYNLGTSSGDIEFMNSDDEMVELMVTLEDLDADGEDDVILGDGIARDEQIYFRGTPATNVCTFPTAAVDVEDAVEECEGARWLMSFAGEAHILELTDISWDDGDSTYEVDVSDETYGTSDDDNSLDLGGTATGSGSFRVTGAGDITIEILDGGANGNISLSTADTIASGTNPIETENEMFLSGFRYIDAGGGAGTAQHIEINWTEEEPAEADSSQAVISTIIKPDDFDEDADLELTPPAGGGANGVYGGLDFSDDNDDDTVYYTLFGTWIVVDEEDNQRLEITYPQSDVEADLFITPIGALVSETGGDCQVREEINPIPSTVNKFDTEIAGVSEGNIPQSMITVGGPCANAVTSALMGNPEVCDEGFDSGMALLKLIEDGDNIALIVAGGTGPDTRIASTVLQNFDEYADELTGSELRLTTVSESNIGFEQVE